MFTVMDPPEVVLPEDYIEILAAARLVDIFAIASAEMVGDYDTKVGDKLTDQEREQMYKVSAACGGLTFQGLDQQILGQAFGIYIQDLYCRAALRILPEEKLVRCIPREMATPEIANVVQRYDMFTMSHLIRLRLGMG